MPLSLSFYLILLTVGAIYRLRHRGSKFKSESRVQKPKTAGKSTDEIAASKPLADLDPVWGHGMLSSDLFAQMISSHFNSHPAGGLDHCSGVGVEEILNLFQLSSRLTA